MRIDPETIERAAADMRVNLKARHYKKAAGLAEALSTRRIAHVLTQVDPAAAARCLTALPAKRAGRILTHLPVEFATGIIRHLPVKTRAGLFNAIPADYLSRLHDALPEDERKELLASLGDDLRAFVVKAVEYPEDSAGRIMSPHFIAVDDDMTVGATLEALLQAPPEIERTPYVYVNDSTGKLVGVLSVKDLLRSSPALTTGQAMTASVVMVRVDDSALEAATLIRNRRFTMLPVADAGDRLVGVITFDDAMSVLSLETSHLITAAGAVTSEESFFTPPTRAIRGRLPWMAANIFLNLGAVAVIAGFEETIATVAILAAFIPMITDMGGNVGIQSLSVAIRSIALGEARFRDIGKVLRKEIMIGVMNGICLGALFAVLAYLLRGNLHLAILAGVALGINVLIAGLVGGCLPFAIRAVGRDPAMMTGPILTTITDITGVSIYLGLSTLFILRVAG